MKSYSLLSFDFYKKKSNPNLPCSVRLCSDASGIGTTPVVPALSNDLYRFKPNANRKPCARHVFISFRSRFTLNASWQLITA